MAYRLLYKMNHFHFIAIVFATVSMTSAQYTQEDFENCDRGYFSRRLSEKIDLVFLMDGSTSIHSSNFSREILFITSVVEEFNYFGPAGVKVGLIQFNSSPFIEFLMRTFHRKEDIIERVNRTPYIGGLTKTGKAIEAVARRAFKGDRGDRPSVPNVMVVLSDGWAQDDVEAPSEFARREGIDVFSVSVGLDTNLEQLELITGGRANRLFLLPKNKYKGRSVGVDEDKDNIKALAKQFTEEIKSGGLILKTFVQVDGCGVPVINRLKEEEPLQSVGAYKKKPKNEIRTTVTTPTTPTTPTPKPTTTSTDETTTTTTTTTTATTTPPTPPTTNTTPKPTTTTTLDTTTITTTRASTTTTSTTKTTPQPTTTTTEPTTTTTTTTEPTTTTTTTTEPTTTTTTPKPTTSSTTTKQTTTTTTKKPTTTSKPTAVTTLSQSTLTTVSFTLSNETGPTSITGEVDNIVREEVPNLPESEVSITCMDNGFVVGVDTETPFTGWFFAKGYYGNERCREDHSNNTQLTARLKLTMGTCGLTRTRVSNPPGLVVSGVVVLMRHRMFIMKGDKAYKVECFYAASEKMVSQEIDVDMLPTETILINNNVMPECDYSIRRGSYNGPKVRFVQVGDTVFHRWNCKQQNYGNIYGMLVHSCYVTNEKGNRTLIVNENGCPLDSILLSTLEYNESLMVAYSQSMAFKYADSENVQFQCKLKFCLQDSNMCNEITPPKCTTKRSIVDLSNPAVEAEKLIKLEEPISDVFSQLRISDAPLQLSPSERHIINNSSDSSDVCVNPYSFVISIMVCLILTFIVFFTAFAMYKNEPNLKSQTLTSMQLVTVSTEW